MTSTPLLDASPEGAVATPPAGREEADAGRQLLFAPDCPTPRSLMLHSGFGPQRMEALAQEIIQSGLRTVTYRTILADLVAGQCPADDLIIITLDDLGTHWMRPTFRDMIDVFLDHELVLVVGAVVRPPQDPSVWAYLREVEARGVEVASHTVHHYSLTQLRPEGVAAELGESYRIICEELGRCPVTIILPFGNGGEVEAVFEAAIEYTFVVGIREGRVFGGEPPFYLGRIPPNNDNQGITLGALERWYAP